MAACKHKFCRRSAAKGRRECNTCSSRIHRTENPIRYAYQNLKDNAKRRGKRFQLTLEQFTEFAVKTEYIEKRGRSKTGYHIDRIREWEGYHIGNIQVLENTRNVKKKLEFDWRLKYARYRRVDRPFSVGPTEETPF